MRRRPHPLDARPLLRPRDPVGELLLVLVVAAGVLAVLIGTATVLSLSAPA